MKATVEEVIQHYIRKNAKAIHDLKQNAKKQDTHIHPKSNLWATYTGYKREASKWLIALHIQRNNNDKRHCHISDKYPYLIAYANKSLFQLAEKLRNPKYETKFQTMEKEIAEERRLRNEALCASA